MCCTLTRGSPSFIFRDVCSVSAKKKIERAKKLRAKAAGGTALSKAERKFIKFGGTYFLALVLTLSSLCVTVPALCSKSMNCPALNVIRMGGWCL